jgi:hypothetical protein
MDAFWMRQGACQAKKASRSGAYENGAVDLEKRK